MIVCDCVWFCECVIAYLKKREGSNQILRPESTLRNRDKESTVFVKREREKAFGCVSA